MAGQELTLLADGLSGLTEQWGHQKYLLGLTRRWPKMVGPVLAQNSLPAYFLGTELWIYTTHAIWMQQLGFAKPELLAKVNTFLQEYGGPQVYDLRWTLQPADFPALPAQQPDPPLLPVDPAEEQEIQAMSEAIADPEARAAFCRLWRSMAQRSK
jgi:predicted nucleic acid-binding Zn ribbon protein